MTRNGWEAPAKMVDDSGGKSDEVPTKMGGYKGKNLLKWWFIGNNPMKSKKWATPNSWMVREDPIEMDDVGVPP